MMETNMYFLMMRGIDPDMIYLEEEKLNKYKEFNKISQEELNIKIQNKWKLWLTTYQMRLQKELIAVNYKKEESKEDPRSLPKITFSTLEEWSAYRQDKMNKINPLYILRNYMAEEAISKAEKGDYSGVKQLLNLLLRTI